jgi:hypothetical protein
MGIIHGFENSWGTVRRTGRGPAGLDHLLHLRRFFTDIVPFADLTVDRTLVREVDRPPGHSPLALSAPNSTLAVVYLPTGGDVTLASDGGFDTSQWFNPRTGQLADQIPVTNPKFSPPALPIGDRPDDWVLILRGA